MLSLLAPLRHEKDLSVSVWRPIMLSYGHILWRHCSCTFETSTSMNRRNFRPRLWALSLLIAIHCRDMPFLMHSFCRKWLPQKWPFPAWSPMPLLTLLANVCILERNGLSVGKTLMSCYKNMWTIRKLCEGENATTEAENLLLGQLHTCKTMEEELIMPQGQVVVVVKHWQWWLSSSCGSFNLSVCNCTGHKKKIMDTFYPYCDFPLKIVSRMLF